jgi:predicted amidohydrolase
MDNGRQSSQSYDALLPPVVSSLKVALVQICSTQDVQRNCDRAIEWVRQAARGGARWVLLPENVCYIRREGDRIGWSESVPGEVVGQFRQAARECQLYILLGSIPERLPNSEKVYNTSILVSPDGGIAATYRKLHLFDAVLPDGQTLNESRFVEKGGELTVADVDGVKVGLSICYDLRFPELYRALAVAGAEIMAIPSAFTVPTGKAHWEVLLRARAIENQVFVLAPAQTGQHSASRRSYGHSLIIDPWGRIVAAATREETILEATLELNQVHSVRQRMPCLQHQRLLRLITLSPTPHQTYQQHTPTKPTNTTKNTPPT